MARKIPGLRRVLDAQSIASVAYAEIGSSLYFALGIVALFAFGLTPWVLLIVGAVFALVAMSYAEGVAAMPEPGGAALFVRRAFNDPVGFLTGWVLLLDYLIVIALAGLFVPHYAGGALGWRAVTVEPWDGIAGVGVILAVAATRLVRRTELYRIGIAVAGLAVVTHAVLAILGLAFVFSPGDLGNIALGSEPSWTALAFALALATLAYTGLETVANFAAEVREPGRTLPRSLFFAIGAVVVMTVVVGLVATSVADLGTEWRRAPLLGIVAALEDPLPSTVVAVLRVFVGASGVIVLVAAITTSISGAGRLTYSLGRYEMLPHAFARLSRRTLIAPAAIAAAALLASGFLLAADAAGGSVRSLASLYSFGVLLAFTAAQVAVVRLRFSEPELQRPFRAPGEVRVRGVPVPVAALVGIPLTFVLWIAAMATHSAARIAGPIWLLVGAAIFVGTRLSAHEPLLERVTPAEPDLVPEPEGAYERILVPLKLGPIGEEVLATAIKLAEERGGFVRALHVIRVPLELPLDAELAEAREVAEASLTEAKALAAEQGVDVQGKIVRARALGEAIVEEARREGVDLIVMGSAPRWRRQARFFSPTVDYVLRHAPCEVMVVAYPQGVLEETTVEA